MAKVHLDRIKTRYGYRNEKLSKLMGKILANNQENVARGLARQTKEKWQKVFDKIPGARKKIVVPPVDEAMRPRDFYIVKGAQNGKLITDNLRDRLTKDLRAVLNRQSTGGKPIWHTQPESGKRGKLHPDVIKEFRARIEETFHGYTKRDPKIGIPPNVKAIAVTEIRSATNMMKDEYARAIVKHNPQVEMFKKWIHNKSLTKNPRRGHLMVNGMAVRLNEYFNVPNYVEKNGRLVLMGFNAMDRPHDPKAPPEQVISCQCEAQYFAKVPNPS